MINQDAKNPVPPVTHTLPLSPSISLSLSQWRWIAQMAEYREFLYIYISSTLIKKNSTVKKLIKKII
jgi:hypothetical protein